MGVSSFRMRLGRGPPKSPFQQDAPSDDAQACSKLHADSAYSPELSDMFEARIPVRSSTGIASESRARRSSITRRDSARESSSRRKSLTSLSKRLSEAAFFLSRGGSSQQLETSATARRRTAGDAEARARDPLAGVPLQLATSVSQPATSGCSSASFSSISRSSFSGSSVSRGGLDGRWAPQQPLPQPYLVTSPFSEQLQRTARNEPLFGHSRYRKLRSINSGSSGFVELAVDMHTGEHVAVKFIARGEGFSHSSIQRELFNQRMCAGHPHIVQILDVFLLPEYLAIVMEYCNRGDLAEYMAGHMAERGRGLSEVEARRLLQQLLVALQFSHSRGIANRDVKLDNILLHVEPSAGPGAKPSLKLCDFGYSKNEDQLSMSKSGCGTPEYVAPEVLSCLVYDGKKTDVWGVGVVLYVLLAGGFPFLTASEEAADPMRKMRYMLPRILAGDYLPLPNPVSPMCEHLLQQLLMPDPHRRLSLAEAMAHPWTTPCMPASLATLNARILERDRSPTKSPSEPSLQSVRELREIVAAARSLGTARRPSLPATAADASVALRALEAASMPDAAAMRPSSCGY